MSSRSTKRHSKASKRAPRQPIFVVCQGRTGSTLLRYILDTHEEIYCPPEVPWQFQIDNSVRLIKILFGAEPLHGNDGMRWEESIIEDAKQRFRSIMDEATGENGKRLWCLTHAHALKHLPGLKKVYPEANYICLYRHCMDFIHSALDVSRYDWNACNFYNHISARDPSRVVNSLADYWCKHTKANYDFEQEKSYQCFRIKYESMVLQTQSTCRELFAFLGVNYSDDLVENIFVRKHQRGFGDSKILGTHKIESRSVGQGRKILTDMIDPVTLEKMNALLKELDYETVGADWCSKPASMYAVGDELAQRFAAEKLKQIFEHTIPNRLKSISSSKNPSTCEVRVKDIEDATWFIDFGAGECVRSNGKQIPDCKIFVYFETLVGLFRKEINPLSAIRDGLAFYQGERGKLAVRDFGNLIT